LPPVPDPPSFARRRFLVHSGAITAGIAAEAHLRAASAEPVGGPVRAAAGETLAVRLRINGTLHELTLDARVTLLDALRERLGLTGTKKGCDHGQCGACTVLANGRRINSCLALAASHDGEEITTIEGLARGGKLHPVQAAFIVRDAFQCGYCTPGQIVSCVAMIEEARRGDASIVTADLAATGAATLDDAQIRERMSGNLCRCGAYPGIVAAARDAARRA
jgi:xanthine dehydrogenase YagT iron-sulfur-binding subunit